MKAGTAFAIDDVALVDSNVPETETAWDHTHTYAMGDACRQTIDGVHRRFESPINGNLNNDPAAGDVTKWTDKGPTNRWAQYDRRQQQQTSNADSIYSKIQVVGRIDTLYAANLAGQSLHVKATDATDGVVYDQTFEPVSTSGIVDWARFFRDPVVGLRDKGITDLPLGYSDLLLEVTIANPGETALCGELVLAFLKELGGTRLGGKLGNKSYSRLTDDAWGDDFISKRGKKRTGAFEVLVDNEALDDVTTLLDDLDATPVLFVASERFSSTFIYGVMLDWSEVLQWRNRTSLSINLQSFTPHMTMPTFTDPPVAPSRSMSNSAFVVAANAFVAWMVTFQGEIVSAVAWLASAIAQIAADLLASAGYAATAQTASAAAVAATAYVDTCATSVSLTLTAKALTLDHTGKGFANGDRVTLKRRSDPNAFGSGPASSCNMGAGTMVVTFDKVVGSATGATDWIVILSALDSLTPEATTSLAAALAIVL